MPPQMPPPPVPRSMLSAEESMELQRELIATYFPHPPERKPPHPRPSSPPEPRGTVVYVRPDFEWSARTLKKAAELIRAHDQGGHKGCNETVKFQVKMILDLCRNYYFRYGWVRDCPENTQAQFEEMCLKCFPNEIFLYRNDMWPGDRRPGLDGSADIDQDIAGGRAQIHGVPSSVQLLNRLQNRRASANMSDRV